MVKKNFCQKKVLGFLVQTILTKKIWGQKKFWLKKKFGEKRLWSKKNHNTVAVGGHPNHI